MKKLLVTGCAGFIGSHTVEAILKDSRFKDYSIVGIDNFDPFYDPRIKQENLKNFENDPRFQFIEGFTGNSQLLNRIFNDNQIVGVIHLAARAGVGPSLKNPEAYAHLNLMGSQELFHLAGKSKVEQFLFASSSSVYGSDAKPPFKEDEACLEPLSPYAATKRAGEICFWNAFHISKMPSTTLRFFTVYGPRQRPEMAIAKFFRSIESGEPITLFNEGKLQRDFTFVSDIVDGILNSYFFKKSESHFDIFNLGNSQTISVLELVQKIESIVGRKAQIQFVPAPAGEMIITHADLTRSKKYLGYAPKVSIDRGLMDYFQWLKNSNSKSTQRQEMI